MISFNYIKEKLLVISKRDVIQLIVDNESVTKVNHFQILGIYRIQRAREAFLRLTTNLGNSQLKLQLTIKFLKCWLTLRL